MALLLAYNTNGLCHHRPADALRVLADLGYGGVAVTPDVGTLDPLGDWQLEAERLGELARSLGLVLSLESGARYLQDPWNKHGPSLLDPDPAQRRRRLELLQRHVDLAVALGARGLSVWAGAAPGGLRGDPPRSVVEEVAVQSVASAAQSPGRPAAQPADDRQPLSALLGWPRQRPVRAAASPAASAAPAATPAPAASGVSAPAPAASLGSSADSSLGGAASAVSAPLPATISAPSQPGHAKPPSSPEAAALERCWEHLTAGLTELLAYAAERQLPLWFEPEPGMFIERPAGYRVLCERLGSAGKELGLTLDVGHCHCTRDLPVARIINEFAPQLRHIHLADIRGNEHVHLPFGQGDLDLPAVVQALQQLNFTGLCAVELSRDSHRGPLAAREALTALRAAGA